MLPKVQLSQADENVEICQHDLRDFELIIIVASQIQFSIKAGRRFYLFYQVTFVSRKSAENRS
jgi:hypothetical protein